MKKLVAFLSAGVLLLPPGGWGQSTGHGGQPKLMLPIGHTSLQREEL